MFSVGSTRAGTARQYISHKREKLKMSTQINVKIVSLYSLVLTFNSCNTVHCPQKLGERMPFVTKRFKQIPAYAGKRSGHRAWAGSRDIASSQGVRGANPPEAESLLAFRHPIEAANLPYSVLCMPHTQFFCHVMRCINVRYLLTCLLTYLWDNLCFLLT